MGKEKFLSSFFLSLLKIAKLQRGVSWVGENEKQFRRFDQLQHFHKENSTAALSKKKKLLKKQCKGPDYQFAYRPWHRSVMNDIKFMGLVYFWHRPGKKPQTPDFINFDFKSTEKISAPGEKVFVSPSTIDFVCWFREGYQLKVIDSFCKESESPKKTREARNFQIKKWNFVGIESDAICWKITNINRTFFGGKVFEWLRDTLPQKAGTVVKKDVGDILQISVLDS